MSLINGVKQPIYLSGKNGDQSFSKRSEELGPDMVAVPNSIGSEHYQVSILILVDIRGIA